MSTRCQDHWSSGVSECAEKVGVGCLFETPSRSDGRRKDEDAEDAGPSDVVDDLG